MIDTQGGRALLQGVIDDPGDDAIRLIFADWLDENGEAERAEFIRVQVAAAALRDAAPERHALERRAEELAYDGDRGPVAQVGRLMRPRRIAWSWWRDCSEAKLQDLDDAPKVLLAALRFRRGFVESVRCPLAEWRAHGPAVAKAHPVTRVELTDAFAVHRGSAGRWGVVAYGAIPHELDAALSHVGWHDSEASAAGALSAALIAYARAQP